MPAEAFAHDVEAAGQRGTNSSIIMAAEKASDFASLRDSTRNNNHSVFGSVLHAPALAA
jgi:hypothetical protein